MCLASMRESRDSVRFVINTQVQSHALLRREFGSSVPFIVLALEGTLKHEMWQTQIEIEICKFEVHHQV